MGEMTLWSAALLLFLVMDPVGNVPIFVSVLSGVDPKRRARIVFREMLIALAILVIFLFGGPYLLQIMGVSKPALEIAGGLLLLLIAIRMVFPQRNQAWDDELSGEPLIVPLAVPMVAGPSALATVIVIFSSDPSRWQAWFLALLLAWAVSCVILVSAAKLSRKIGRRGLIALERLMGMIVVAIGVEMMVRGVRVFVNDIQTAAGAG